MEDQIPLCQYVCQCVKLFTRSSRYPFWFSPLETRRTSSVPSEVSHPLSVNLILKRSISSTPSVRPVSLLLYVLMDPYYPYPFRTQVLYRSTTNTNVKSHISYVNIYNQPTNPRNLLPDSPIELLSLDNFPKFVPLPY